MQPCVFGCFIRCWRIANSNPIFIVVIVVIFVITCIIYFALSMSFKYVDSVFDWFSFVQLWKVYCTSALLLLLLLLVHCFLCQCMSSVFRVAIVIIGQSNASLVILSAKSFTSVPFYYLPIKSWQLCTSRVSLHQTSVSPCLSFLLTVSLNRVNLSSSWIVTFGLDLIIRVAFIEQMII